MNQIDFLQTGGFPVETETFDALQQAYKIFQAFGYLAGGKAIISGCEEQNNTISNGVIFIDGELIEFRGASKQTKIIIKEEVTEVEFEDRQLRPVYRKRYAQFGTGTTTYNWEDFKRLDTIVRLMERIEAQENRTIPDAVLPATQAEVDARTVETKYVSPKTLPMDSLLVSGEISATGSRINYYKIAFTSSRQSTGTYRINHNIGHTKYGCIGSGVTAGVLKVGIKERTSTYCVVQVSDDSTLNDGQFTFQIFKTAP